MFTYDALHIFMFYHQIRHSCRYSMTHTVNDSDKNVLRVSAVCNARVTSVGMKSTRDTQIKPSNLRSASVPCVKCAKNTKHYSRLTQLKNDKSTQ
jgi:hypothetical protein